MVGRLDRGAPDDVKATLWATDCEGALAVVGELAVTH